jgi:hypothetical protein
LGIYLEYKAPHTLLTVNPVYGGSDVGRRSVAFQGVVSISVNSLVISMVKTNASLVGYFRSASHDITLSNS